MKKHLLNLLILMALIAGNQLGAQSNCQTAPVMQCPSSFFSCPQSSTDPSVTGMAIATAGEPACPNPVIMFEDEILMNQNCMLKIHRTFTASYNDPNINPWIKSSCTQIIELIDDQAPILTACPSNIAIDLSSNGCDSTAVWSAPTATDNCGLNSFGGSHVSGSNFPEGTTTVSYTAVDNCGLTATCSFTVTVTGVCCEAPIINCPHEATICPGGSTDPSITGFATAISSNPLQCATPTVTYSDLIISTGNCNGEQEIERTWTATNVENGLSVSCVQPIHVVDNTNPIFNFTPSNIEIQATTSSPCSATATWSEPIAFDNCTLQSINSSHLPGDSFDEGITTVSYTAVDNCGNSTVISFTVSVTCLTCNSNPVVTCPPDRVRCPGTTNLTPAVLGTAMSSPGSAHCDNPVLTFNDNQISTGPCNGQALIQRTWTATDPINNNLSASCIQSISLSDEIAPIIMDVPDDIVIEIQSGDCEQLVKWPIPMRFDNCGIASWTSNIPNASVLAAGIHTIVYTATDNCGNSSTASFTVTINCNSCNTPPTISCPANTTLCVNADTSPSATGFATATAASSLCGTPNVSFSDQVISTNPNCAGAQVIQRTWTAVDSDNAALSATCIQTISTEDNVAPTINNVPQNISLNANGANCSAIANWSAPNPSDNCAIASFTSSHNSGQSFNEGTTSVSYTAVDNCGNSTSVSFTVTVSCTCNTPPTISCPANTTLCVNADTSPSATGFATATAASSLCGTPNVSFSDQVISTNPNCAGAQVIQRTWTAVDSDNAALSATCIQTISTEDNVAPTINNVPQNISLNANGANCSAIANWSAPNPSDNCAIASFTSSHNSGQSFNEGTTSVSYTAVDNCGNSTSVSFTVTVSCTCNTPPTISCPANTTLCVNADTSPSATGFATATAASSLCGTPNVSFSDQVISTNPNCPGAQVIQRTWTAVDSDNPALSATCIQTISTEDNLAPNIDNVPQNISLNANGANCSAIANWSAPNPSDNCAIASFTSSHNSGQSFNEGTTSVSYTAVDNCGNSTSVSFTVTVSCTCNTPPTISCPANTTLCVNADTSPSATGFATATAASSLCGTPNVSFSDQVISTNPNCPGAQVIQRTWTAVDSDNAALSATCIQTISTEDNVAPTINNVPQNISLNANGANCSAIANWSAPNPSDNCAIASFTSSHNSGQSFNEGTTSVSYTAVDNCGNSTSVSFTVTVSCTCNTPPTISCPANTTLCVNADTSPSATGFATATAASSLCGTPNVSFSDQVISTNPNCPGAQVIQRTWTAVDSDNAALSATCIQTISTEDNVAPTINNVPQNISLNANGANCSAIANWSAPNPSDNCAIASFTSSHNSGQSFNEGTTSVSYTAVDNCGNSTSVSFTVTVSCTCNTPPTISCPANTTLCVNADTSPSATGFATATAASSLCGTPNVSFSDQVISTNPNCPGAQVIQRTWTAVDSDNPALSATCIQTISTEDNLAPNIDNVPQNISLNANGANCSAIANWSAPNPSDNCAIASFTSSHNSGQSFNEGTTSVSYTAVDNCGNSTSVTFTVTVSCSCNTPPIISCPANATLCVNADTSPASTGSGTALLGGSLCGMPNVSFSDQVISTNPNCAGAQVIQRTWTAVDSDNPALSATCIQTISTEDNVAPTINNVPQNISLNANGANCSAIANWSAPNPSDNCAIASFTSSHNSGQSFNEGTTSVSYTAVDNCGNSTSVSFTVTVSCTCNTPPTISCPANTTLCVNADTSPSATGFATATAASSLCGTPNVSFSDQVISTNPNCAGAQVIQRTWTAVDSDNAALSATCIQTISTEDNLAPTIDNVPQNITVNGNGPNCSAIANWSLPIFNDNCGLTSTNSSHSTGSTFSQGTTTITLTGVDHCGNTTNSTFTVTVECKGCTTPPIITCPAPHQVCPGIQTPGPAISGYATALPAQSSCPMPTLSYNDVIVSTGPCAGAKNIERTWTATYPGTSMSSSCIQSVSANDNTTPYFITCPDDITVHGVGANCSAKVWWTHPTVGDNCSQVSTVARNEQGQTVYSNQLFDEGTETITLTATDQCGNSTTCSFELTVECTTCTAPPVISCPSSRTICPGSSISPTVLGSATAQSATGCPAATVNYSDTVLSTGPCAGEKVIKRTWVASYDFTNAPTISCIQMIYVKDDIAPTIHNCPIDIYLSNPGIATWNSPTASDNCGNPNLYSTHNSGSTFNADTEVTFTAVDACGNIRSCTFNVFVLQNVTVNCPSDTIIPCGSGVPTVVTWEEPTLQNTCNCSASGLTYLGEFNGHKYYKSSSYHSWHDAKAIAESKGGHLVVLNSVAENNFVAPFANKSGVWIGMTDEVVEGQYKWINGDPVTFYNWYTGQPNNYNGNQDHIEMIINGQWNDEYGGVQNQFIMELSCGSVTQTSGPSNGTALNPGTYTVEYTLTDNCGNSENCSFDITVASCLNITCPPDITVQANQGNTYANVNWNLPTTSSGCCNSNTNINGFVYMGTHGGHKYYCSALGQNNTWINAKAICEANGGHLAVINSSAENSFLANKLNPNGQTALIGLSDYQQEGDFEWVNGNPLGYTNWQQGQPNNSQNQDFVGLMNTGKWNDVGHVSLEYIMEIPECVTVTQLTGPTNGSIFNIGTTTVTYHASDQCGNAVTCSFDVTVETSGGNGGTQNCPSYAQNPSDINIRSVVFGSLVNSSTNTNGYGEFLNDCSNFISGDQYPMNLTPSISTHEVFWKVWIDYNGDGIFDNENFEFVAQGAEKGPVHAVISIPSGLQEGKVLMRIICRADQYPEGPCDVYPVGETEDYCIAISGGKARNELSTEVSVVSLLSDNSLSSRIVESPSIKVYPNPAHREALLDLTQLGEVSSVYMTDANGNLVKEFKNVNGIQEIPVHNIPDGLYQIVVRSSDGNQYYQKVMVQN